MPQALTRVRDCRDRGRHGNVAMSTSVSDRERSEVRDE